MARLRWREILADDGTNDGWETTNGRWVISSSRHIGSGAVDYWFERAPMLETEERRESMPVYQLVDDVARVVKDDDGAPVTTEVVHLEVLRDERPQGSTDVDDLKALAQAHEDSPTAYAEVLGKQKAASQHRRGLVKAQREAERAAEQRAANLAALIDDDDLLDALAEALKSRGA